LAPLAISSPFWQGLAVVLIFGLLSSTLLVVTVFPYYYLGAEYLRMHISTKDFFIWAIVTAVIAGVIGGLTSPGVGFLMVLLSLIYVIFQGVYKRRLRKA